MNGDIFHHLNEALMEAVEDGDEETTTIAALLAAGANIDYRRPHDPHGWTPLHVACEAGDYKTAALLLEYGASVHVTLSDGASPLWFAAFDGQSALLQRLLDHGARDSPIDSGPSAIQVACQNGHLETVQILLHRGGAHEATQALFHVCRQGGSAELLQTLLQNKADIHAMWELQDQTQLTPLGVACSFGQLDIARHLIAMGACLEAFAFRPGQVSPLVAASCNGHVSIVNLLLQHGADINAVDSEDQTALYWAITKNHLAVFDVLFANGAKLSATARDSDLLLLVSELGRMEMVNSVLCKGLEHHKVYLDGEKTPLHVAAENGHLGAVRLLVWGYKWRSQLHMLDYRDDESYTPLQLAVEGGHLDVVQCLRDFGAACNDAELFTAASKGGDLELVRQLVTKGVQIAHDEQHEKPLIFACQGGHLDVVEFLIQSGANVETRSRAMQTYNETALFIAAKKGFTNIVKVLVESGANVDATSGLFHLTPLLVASAKGHFEIVQLLLLEGANIELGEIDNARQLKIPLWFAAEEGHYDIVKALIIRHCETWTRPVSVTHPAYTKIEFVYNC